MKITKKRFGEYHNKEVLEYTLDNGRDLNIKVLNLGCILREINFKGKNRVLGYSTVEEYLNNEGNVGTVVGRVAGRISNGRINIDGKVYELDKNEGSTCLHGGSEGFARQIWEIVDEEIGEDYISLKLKYISNHMESGFPGRLVVYTKYIINKYNDMIIEYFAETDKPTIVSLTNHSYFNLNNDLNEDILNNSLKINSDEYISLDKANIPKSIKKVEGSPFDFRIDRTIDEYMDLSHVDLKNTEGYDHPFILKKDKNKEIFLKSNTSGISLSIETMEPTVVLYTSNKLKEGMDLSGGEKTYRYQGVCLETQWYSDAINQDFLPKNILRRGKEYYSRSKYSFRDKI